MKMSEIYSGSQRAHDIFLVNKAGLILHPVKDAFKTIHSCGLQLLYPVNFSVIRNDQL